MQRTENEPTQVGRKVGLLLLVIFPVLRDVHNKSKGNCEDIYMDDSIRMDHCERMLNGFIQASTTNEEIMFRVKPGEDTKTEEDREPKASGDFEDNMIQKVSKTRTSKAVSDKDNDPLETDSNASKDKA